MGSAEREAEVFVPWLLQAHAQVSAEGPGYSLPTPRRLEPTWRRLSLSAQELTDILHSPDPDGHYGVPISLAELAAANHGAAELLLKAPRQVCRRSSALPRSRRPCGAHIASSHPIPT